MTSFHGDTGDLRWECVSSRDATARGRFVYAVRTTGVYCQPGCPSRTPRRANVEFFETTQQAKAAGYRACRRCSPDETEQDPVVTACRLMMEEGGPATATDLADAVGLSRSHFSRTFKEALGLTPKAFAEALRARRLQQRLGQSPVLPSALEAGYGSASQFYAAVKRDLGMSVAEFRQGGPPELSVAHAQTRLGSLLVAATEQGVCSVQLGDDESELRETLGSLFPNAALLRPDSRLQQWVEMLQRSLADGCDHALGSIPLDVRGAAFYSRLWQALREIPWGETITYKELGTQLGKQSAARVVANACAANPCAILIPCHRVVRADGLITGFRWGPERKAALLALEQEGEHAKLRNAAK